MKEITHGSSSGYGYYKCRCELCKKAHADRNRPHNKIYWDRHFRKTGQTRSVVDPAKRKQIDDAKILRESIKSEPVYSFIGKRK